MRSLFNPHSLVRHIFIMICSLSFLWSCDKMDRTYSEFLESGQITYNAKLDSVRTYPGRNRILITWRPITDPRITKVKVLWSNNRDSLVKPVSSSIDTIFMIENLDEGNYTFNLITYDDANNSSMKVEILGTAYGELYESGLTPRLIRNTTLNGNTLTIRFNSSEQLNQYHDQEITYTSSIDQAEKTIYLSADTSILVIDDYSGDTFTHRSLYLPGELSPDLFYAETITQYTPQNPLLVYPQNGETGV